MAACIIELLNYLKKRVDLLLNCSVIAVIRPSVFRASLSLGAVVESCLILADCRTMSTPLSDDEVEDDTEGGKQRARKDESECNGADQGEGALSPRADDGVLGKRKRAKKPVRRLVEEDDSSSTSPAPRGKATGKNNKKTRLKNTERIAEIGVSTSLDFEVGEEVYLKEGVHENENFWGEILSINRIKNGEYTLGMVSAWLSSIYFIYYNDVATQANPCHGIWGEAIVRSASKMKA